MGHKGRSVGSDKGSPGQYRTLSETGTDGERSQGELWMKTKGESSVEKNRKILIND